MLLFELFPLFMLIVSAAAVVLLYLKNREADASPATRADHDREAPLE